MKNKIKQLLRYLAWFFALLLFVLLIVWEIFLHTPVIAKQDVHYVLSPGYTARSLSDDLQTLTHFHYPFLFRLLVRIRHVDHSLKAGEYVFSAGSSINNILNQLVIGQVVYHSFTIVEGWTYKTIIKHLALNPAILHSADTLSDKEITKKISAHIKSLEGRLFPDTYYYTFETKDVTIIQAAYQMMDRYLQAAWLHRAKALSYKTSYQALIVASMIEKETGLDQERSLIAAVILKRLKKRMHLQIDPTIIYSLGDQFKGRLTKKDLLHKTPYNTYTNYGLPPTPICMPSAASIEAALHPAETNALYFVATGDGAHVFSSTLKEHRNAVEKYQLHHHKS